jgi:competence/damage-inducible protein CinA-like protein
MVRLMASRAFRRAAIIAVGSEMLTPTRLDTNSLYITEVLNGIGVDVVAKAVVGDDRDELESQFAHALGRTDLVVLTGGLGPTEDDMTREAVAAYLRRPLSEDAQIVEKIRQRFALRGWKMPDVNRRQAMVPEGAVVLDNPNGTAPGLWLDVEEKGVLLLPGPPREMRPMFDRVVGERLAPRSGGLRVFRRVLKIAGRGESMVEEKTQPVYSTWRTGAQPIETTILAMPGQVELHLSTRGADVDAMNRALDAAVAQIDEVLGLDIFTHENRSLEDIVGELLRGREWKIALAESCTGGLATSRLTDVPGASDYVERSVVAYSNEAKIELLGVDPELIRAHGAVSEPVAQAMAEGIRVRARVDVGVGITGIAGPGGGSEHKPVGTVCISVVGPGAGQGSPPMVTTRTFRFPGNRELVKAFSALTALDMVRRAALRRD